MLTLPSLNKQHQIGFKIVDNLGVPKACWVLIAHRASVYALRAKAETGHDLMVKIKFQK